MPEQLPTQPLPIPVAARFENFALASSGACRYRAAQLRHGHLAQQLVQATARIPVHIRRPTEERLGRMNTF